MTTRWEALMAAHEEARDRERSVVPEHRPRTAILACSDARVPPSIIFDQPAGSLFVVRVAGNTPTPSAVASLDYAVDELGVELIVVLGHTSCGAVAAACAGSCDGYLEPLTSAICALVDQRPCIDADGLAAANVRSTVQALTAFASPTGRAIRSGRVNIEGAVYDLATDQIRTPPPSPPTNPLNHDIDIDIDTDTDTEEPVTP